MASRLFIHPLGQPHGPGWSVDDREERDLDDPSTRLYQLWAPRPATEGQPAREHYAASWWIGDGLTQSGYRRAGTAEAALARFPSDKTSQAAKRLLLDALKRHEEEQA